MRYFLFNLPDIQQEEIIILIHINIKLYNLIYPKRNNQKNKKLYSSPDKIGKNKKNFFYNNKRIEILKKNKLMLYIGVLNICIIKLHFFRKFREK